MTFNFNKGQGVVSKSKSPNAFSNMQQRKQDYMFKNTKLNENAEIVRKKLEERAFEKGNTNADTMNRINMDNIVKSKSCSGLLGREYMNNLKKK